MDTVRRRLPDQHGPSRPPINGESTGRSNGCDVYPREATPGSLISLLLIGIRARNRRGSLQYIQCSCARSNLQDSLPSPPRVGGGEREARGSGVDGDHGNHQGSTSGIAGLHAEALRYGTQVQPVIAALVLVQVTATPRAKPGSRRDPPAFSPKYNTPLAVGTFCATNEVQPHRVIVAVPDVDDRYLSNPPLASLHRIDSVHPEPRLQPRPRECKLPTLRPVTQ